MAVGLIDDTHSPITENDTGLAIGWLVGRFLSEGQRWRDLGAHHRDAPIAAVFVSDRARAVEIAKLAFGAADAPICQEPDSARVMTGCR